jgi:hypothetical protein
MASTTHRIDQPGIACPDCGSQVFQQFVAVSVEEQSEPIMAPGDYDCRNRTCDWQSPVAPPAQPR